MRGARHLALVGGAAALVVVAHHAPAGEPPPVFPCVAKTYTLDEALTTLTFSFPAPSELWCGHLWRQYGRDMNPKPDTYEGTSEPASTCHGMAKKADGTWPAAQTVAEVRGWIRGTPSDAKTAEAEVTFDLEPDIGWAPKTPNVFAVNTFERVAQWMRPVKQNKLGRFHVELNLWGPNRVCGADLPDLLGHYAANQEAYYNNGNGPYCKSYTNGATGTPRRPAAFCFVAPGVQAYWPFDALHPPHAPGTEDRPFHDGDYVRIVGTLWEDYNHNDADPCWNDGHTKGRGWVELHPVDFIARIPEPNGVKKSPIAYVPACIPSSSSTRQTWIADVSPREPRPGPGFKLQIREIVDAEFTDFASLSQRSSTADGRTSVVGSVGKVSVELSSVQFKRRGLFHAAYLATWAPCTPQCDGRCAGSDGCGGVCPSTCPSGKTCSEGQCCPTGKKYCVSSESCETTCATCAPCDCGGTSCNGSAACAAVCRAQNPK